MADRERGQALFHGCDQILALGGIFDGNGHGRSVVVDRADITVGGMLRAAELGMIIIVDGFIMTNCVLAGRALYPALTDYCIYGHQGDECGHKLVLDYLGAEPLLNLGLRLGEGTGAICAYPLLESAVNMINEMASFKEAAVTKYFK